MSSFEYTAKDELITGHAVDTIYKFDMGIASYTIGKEYEGWQQLSSNSAVTCINKKARIHRFTTIPLNSTQALEAMEFLASANDGHSIKFDASGTVAVPVNVITGVKMFQKKIMPSQNGQFSVFSFEIIEM